MSSRGHRFYRCGYGTAGHPPHSSKRCRAKILNADRIEQAVWADCERFLRDPGQALDAARAQLAERHDGMRDVTEERRHLLTLLAGKDRERGDI